MTDETVKGPVEFIPSVAGELADDDPRMLHNWLRALQIEMRGGFELLGNKILPTLERIEGAVVDLRLRVAELETAKHRTDARLDALERPRRSPRRKK